MRRYRCRMLGGLAWLCCAVAVVHAADDPTSTQTNDTTTQAADAKETRLPELVVEAPPVFSAASSDEINAERFELRPHTRMIQLLNNIPGLVVAQHQGGVSSAWPSVRSFSPKSGTRWRSDSAMQLVAMAQKSSDHQNRRRRRGFSATARENASYDLSKRDRSGGSAATPGISAASPIPPNRTGAR